MTSEVKYTMVKKRAVIKGFLPSRRTEFMQLRFREPCFMGKCIGFFKDRHTADIFSPHGGPVECTATYEWTEKVRVR